MWKFDSQGKLVSLVDDAHGRFGIWVASEQIVFCRAEFPPGRQRVWEQTAPFVLEEQLIEDVAEQHFVIGRADAGHDKIPVGVVSRASMASWVASWEEKDLSPSMICPDVFAVPCEKDKVVLWHEDDRCLLRLDAQTGIAGSLEWIHSLLELRGKDEAIVIYSDAIEQLPETFRGQAQALPCSLDDRMRMGFDTDALAMNFLRGDFRPTSMLASVVRPWKWAGAAAIALFLVYTASLTVQTKMLNTTTASLKQTTMELYRQNFQVPVPGVSLREQVNRRMEQIKSGVVDRDMSLWKALSYVDPVLSSCKACRVEEINLQESFLSLVLSSSQDIDQLLRQIKNIKQIRVGSEPVNDSGERKRVYLQFEVNPQV